MMMMPMMMMMMMIFMIILMILINVVSWLYYQWHSVLSPSASCDPTLDKHLLVTVMLLPVGGEFWKNENYFLQLFSTKYIAFQTCFSGSSGNSSLPSS